MLIRTQPAVEKIGGGLVVIGGRPCYLIPMPSFTILRDDDRYNSDPIPGAKRFPGSEFPARMVIAGATREQAQAICDSLSVHFDAGCTDLFYIEEE